VVLDEDSCRYRIGSVCELGSSPKSPDRVIPIRRSRCVVVLDEDFDHYQTGAHGAVHLPVDRLTDESSMRRLWFATVTKSDHCLWVRYVANPGRAVLLRELWEARCGSVFQHLT
jgi:hypothetical protein